MTTPSRPDRANDNDLDGPDVPIYQPSFNHGHAESQEIPPTSQQETVVLGSTYADEDFAPATAAVSAAPVPASIPDEELVVPVAAPAPVVDARRGTIDLGIFILRVGLALWLILESVGTFFRLGGSDGLVGLESAFASYAYPGALSLAVPTLQLAAGLFLLFGLVTPLFAGVAVVVTGFMALHTISQAGVGVNVFAWPDAVWVSVMVLLASVAVQFTGPGRYGLDFGREWARRPMTSSWVFFVLAVVALTAAWWFGAGINPLA